MSVRRAEVHCRPPACLAKPTSSHVGRPHNPNRPLILASRPTRLTRFARLRSTAERPTGSALGPCHNGPVRASAVMSGRQRFRGTAGRRASSSSSGDDAGSRIRLWSRRSRRRGEHPRIAAPLVSRHASPDGGAVAPDARRPCPGEC
jgi:hypothetical protein